MGLRYWKNSEIELVRTSAPENRLPFVLVWKQKVEYQRSSCVFWSPPDSGNMQRFEVGNGLASDELDNVVAGWKFGQMMMILPTVHVV